MAGASATQGVQARVEAPLLLADVHGTCRLKLPTNPPKLRRQRNVSRPFIQAAYRAPLPSFKQDSGIRTRGPGLCLIGNLDVRLMES
jgi:hypothetical protein